MPVKRSTRWRRGGRAAPKTACAAEPPRRSGVRVACRLSVRAPAAAAVTS